MYLRRLKQRYMGEQWEMHTGNDWNKKQHFLQNKGNHSNDAYKDWSKSTGRKVGFAAVFTDIARRSLHPHNWNDSNKIEMRERQKREDMRWVIYTLSLSSMLAIENNRKPSNIKSDIWHTSRAP